MGLDTAEAVQCESARRRRAYHSNQDHHHSSCRTFKHPGPQVLELEEIPPQYPVSGQRTTHKKNFPLSS